LGKQGRSDLGSVSKISDLKCHPEPACRQAGLFQDLFQSWIPKLTAYFLLLTSSSLVILNLVQNLFARNVLAILRQLALWVAIFNLARTFLAMGRAGRPGAGYVYPSRTLIRLRQITSSSRQLSLWGCRISARLTAGDAQS
jgi:hypothetical protein